MDSMSLAFTGMEGTLDRQCVYASSRRSVASNSNGQTKSNPQCCAERRLLKNWMVQAKKKGVPSHHTVCWIRRKMGPNIVTWRLTSDGTHGCSVPCVYCRQEIIKFRLRVTCCVGNNKWFCGYLTDHDAPESKLTSGQVASLRNKIY